MSSLSTALTAMRRSPYQTMVAIVMVSLTCLVAYAFSLMLLGAQTVLAYFETQPQVIAFFDLTTTSEQITQAEQAMRQKDYVKEVSVVSKEQALELYRQDKEDDPLLLELVSAEILPASIEVSGKTVNDLEQIRNDLQSQSGIEEVVFQRDIIDSLGTWTKSLRYIGLGLSTLLGLTSFLIVMVVIGIKITAKRQAIYVMRIIGASQWYIKRPFMVEGMLYGVVGSVIGWSLMYGCLLYLTPWLRAFLSPAPLFPIPWQVLAVQFVAGSGVAVIIGMFASLTASQRLIRR